MSWRGAFVLGTLVTATVVVGATGASIAGLIIAGLLLTAMTLVLFAHVARKAETLGPDLTDLEAILTVRKDLPVEDQRVPGPFTDMSWAADVTVVVTAHNESQFLATCLSSLQRQSFSDWEAVIVDDASTDGTRSVALDFCRADKRFRLVSLESNVGLAGARNVGLAYASAEMVTFLDGDDFLLEDALAMRFAAMPTLEAKPWVAGVYCNWATVPEGTGIEFVEPTIADRGTVSWFDALYDAPFIASAPMLRTEVIRRSGGFQTALPTAEDTAMWNEILRNGWIFESVDYTGVAYRMKSSSMFKATALDHTNIIQSVAVSNNARASPQADVPFRFTEPHFDYGPRLTRWRRMVGVAAVTIEAGANAEPVFEELELTFESYMAWVIDLRSVAAAAASRVTKHGGASADHDRRRVLSSIMERLFPLVETARKLVLRNLSTPSLTPSNLPGREAVVSRRPHVAPLHLVSRASPLRDKVLLLPAADYHMAELGPLALELDRCGVEAAVMADDRRWPSIRDSVEAYAIPSLAVVEAGDWIKESKAVVAMNDWGEYYRDFIEVGESLGVPTFAKVEGVQDFQDADVHWNRDAYRRAGVVLAQGANDVLGLDGQSTVTVGSTRLERIWKGDPRRYSTDMAIVNLNFTYGVLDDARDIWIETVVEACGNADMPFVVSLHPAERDRYAGRIPVADEPIRHLLTYGSVLISRFSTVPFEAMARGVPFIYHNPHGERVKTFQTPDGAFVTSHDVRSLEDALRATQDWLHSYRSVCANFFASQVDMVEDEPSEARSARVILQALGA